MKKLLLLPLLFAASAFGEVNKSITITNCAKFIDNPAKCVELFEKAAQKAKIVGFTLYQSVSVSGIEYNYFVNHIGYMSIMVNQAENMLYLDFYCADDSFDYNKFITFFVKACYSAEKPHVPTILFENNETVTNYFVIQDEDIFDKLLDYDFYSAESL